MHSLKFKLLNKDSADRAPLIISPIARRVKSQTVDFVDSREESIFKTAKETLVDWSWANRPISYTLNSHGYRMSEFKDVDWDNYVVSLGCSFTVGVGLPVEETYSYRISKLLGMDLVNAGVMGGGNDLILANLYTLLANAPKPPKMIIIGWSVLTRKFYWDDKNFPLPYFSSYENTPFAGVWADAYENFTKNEFAWFKEFQETKKQVDLLCKLANIPNWQFTSYYGYEADDSIEKIPFFKNLEHTLDVDTLNKHFARDVDVEGTWLAHPGLEHQDKIVEHFKRKYL